MIATLRSPLRQPQPKARRKLPVWNFRMQTIRRVPASPLRVTVDDVPPADDGPTAVDDGPVQIVEPADTHAVFVIDTSASLSQEDLALMEEALKNLATTLFEQNPNGTVISLIEFDSNASFMGDGTFYTAGMTSWMLLITSIHWVEGRQIISTPSI